MLKKAVFAIVFTGAFLATMKAQNPRGSLRGTVQDATGARISTAKIVAQLLGSSIHREAVGEDRGERARQEVAVDNRTET